jgi:hypothetical protein
MDLEASLAYERGDSQQLFEQLDSTFQTGRCESFSPRSSASPRGLWGYSTLERKDPSTLPEIEAT